MQRWKDIKTDGEQRWREGVGWIHLEWDGTGTSGGFCEDCNDPWVS